ncbi:MAG: MltA domain-containing protein [Thalassotalea sp.]
MLLLKRIIFIVLLPCYLFFTALNSVAKPAFILDKSPSYQQLNTVDVEALCQVADKTLYYMNQYPDDNFAVHSGSNIFPFSDLTRVKKTLAFICTTHLQDQQAGQTSRLMQADFLQQHFDFYRWYPDKKTASSIARKSTNARKSEMLDQIPEDKIFLTKYYTKLIEGSSTKTQQFNQALYALPFDEQGLSLAVAEQKKTSLVRFKYTRQQVLSGVLSAKNLAKPLVWITEAALHDVLLQGTGVLKVDGKTRYFNVHRNNGIAYNYALGKSEQPRYWYFAEVPSVMGYGQNLVSKIAIKPFVTFAGNVQQLGLGKLFLVAGDSSEPQNSFSRLGILADQGGAFDNNLFQLDYLVASYHGWQDYHQANKNLPDYTNAWLMLLKE